MNSPTNNLELQAMFSAQQKMLVQFRVSLDRVAQNLDSYWKQSYTVLALREIQKARMHLGWALLALGAENPYHNVETVSEIPAPMDKYEGELSLPKSDDANERLKFLQDLRTDLEKISMGLRENCNIQIIEMSAAGLMVRYAHAWLGYAIGEMRKKVLEG